MMSYRWPNKDPDETLDYSIDWSRSLKDGETISSVQWFVDDENGVKTRIESTELVDGLQHVVQTNTNTVATVYLGLGTNNKEYKITCRIVTSESLTLERTVVLRIKER